MAPGSRCATGPPSWVWYCNGGGSGDSPCAGPHPAGGDWLAWRLARAFPRFQQHVSEPQKAMLRRPSANPGAPLASRGRLRPA